MRGMTGKAKIMDLIKRMGIDFSGMSDEDLEELITKAQEAKERRSEGRKKELWNNVRRAVQEYVMDFGVIELFTEDRKELLDADAFSIMGEINALD